MFNLNKYRVRDLDEIVKNLNREIDRYDYMKQRVSKFALLKNCRGYITIDSKTKEVTVEILNSAIHETAVFRGENKEVNLENIEKIFENAAALEYIMNNKSIFKLNKQENIINAHKVMLNLDSLLEGGESKIEVVDILGKEEYEKLISKIDKHFNKRQYEVIDAQTPNPI